MTTTTKRAKKTKLGYATFFCLHCQRTFNERTGTPFNYLEFPTDIVLLTVLWRLCYKLSLRDIEEMFLARGFSLNEQLDTTPPHNPFAGNDLLKKPQMLPRYLSDQEL